MLAVLGASRPRPRFSLLMVIFLPAIAVPNVWMQFAAAALPRERYEKLVAASAWWGTVVAPIAGNSRDRCRRRIAGQRGDDRPCGPGPASVSPAEGVMQRSSCSEAESFSPGSRSVRSTIVFLIALPPRSPATCSRPSTIAYRNTPSASPTSARAARLPGSGSTSRREVRPRARRRRVSDALHEASAGSISSPSRCAPLSPIRIGSTCSDALRDIATALIRSARRARRIPSGPPPPRQGVAEVLAEARALVARRTNETALVALHRWFNRTRRDPRRDLPAEFVAARDSAPLHRGHWKDLKEVIVSMRKEA